MPSKTSKPRLALHATPTMTRTATLAHHNDNPEGCTIYLTPDDLQALGLDPDAATLQYTIRNGDLHLTTQHD